MRETDMETIAGFIGRILVQKEAPEAVGKEVIDFRLLQQTLYYNFDHVLPPWAK